jgi:hypothetical protein
VEIWPVDGPWTGRLAICARPRAGWFLDDDIRALRAAGYQLLVSALTPEEVVRAELESVQVACNAAGLEFTQFPTGNLQVAPAERAHPQLVSWRERLQGGQGVAIHCWASVGRGPTLAAALLVLGGLEPADAWARLEASRGRQVPDTLEQRAWAAAFAVQVSGDGTQ